MVDNYYKVGIEAIKSLAKENRIEISNDGYKTLKGDELRSVKNLCQIKSKARSLAIFPKRAILRVGIL